MVRVQTMPSCRSHFKLLTWHLTFHLNSTSLLTQRICLFLFSFCFPNLSSLQQGLAKVSHTASTYLSPQASAKGLFQTKLFISSQEAPENMQFLTWGSKPCLRSLNLGLSTLQLISLISPTEIQSVSLPKHFENRFLPPFHHGLKLQHAVRLDMITRLNPAGQQ